MKGRSINSAREVDLGVKVGPEMGGIEDWLIG